MDKEKLRDIGDAYCKSRGYDPGTGIPTAETLTKMGLDDMAARLAQKLQESKDWLKPEERETGFPAAQAK